MYAQLGDIIFEGLKGFESFDRKRATVLPRHERIDGKPRLQRTGDQLDEIKLTIKLHSSFCDPEFEYDRLNLYRSDAEVLPFLTGSGRFIGDFIIEELTDKPQFTTTKGEVVSIELEVKLIEFFDPDKEKTESERAISDGFAMNNNNPTPSGQVDPLETDASAVSADTNEALSAANDTNKDISDFKNDTSSLTAIANMIKNAQRAAVKAQNAVARINQASADVQSTASDLKDNLETMQTQAEALKTAAETGDPSAINSAADLFQTSTGAVASATGPVFLLAALRIPA